MYYFIPVVNGNVDFGKNGHARRLQYRNAKSIILLLTIIIKIIHNIILSAYDVPIYGVHITYITIYSYYCILVVILTIGWGVKIFLIS